MRTSQDVSCVQEGLTSQLLERLNALIVNQRNPQRMQVLIMTPNVKVSLGQSQSGPVDVLANLECIHKYVGECGAEPHTGEQSHSEPTAIVVGQHSIISN